MPPRLNSLIKMKKEETIQVIISGKWFWLDADP
jgi:hypothetical protein